jgi:tartrate dehydratase beta subunit/fumarate hydratase class I family protein
MRLRKHFVFLAAITTLLGTIAFMAAPAAMAAVAPATADGWVRCANLSPGKADADVYLIPFGNPGHPIVLRHVDYGEVYSYMPVAAGQYTVAMRPAGAPASSPPVVSTSFMVNAGASYTVVSIGPATSPRLEVLTDQITAPKGTALVRVFQASLKQHLVTISDGGAVLARQLAFGAVTPYMTVKPGVQTVQFSASGTQTSMSVTLTARSVHTIVVLDGSSGLQVDTLTDAAASSVAPRGGAGTGFGGTAPHGTAPRSVPWLATLAAGLLLVALGGVGLRRSRRTAAVARE